MAVNARPVHAASSPSDQAREMSAPSPVDPSSGDRTVAHVRADIASRMALGEFAPGIPAANAAAVAEGLTDKEIALLSRSKSELAAIADGWIGVQYSGMQRVGLHDDVLLGKIASGNGDYSDVALRGWVAQHRNQVRGCLGVAGVLPGAVELHLSARSADLLFRGSDSDLVLIHSDPKFDVNPSFSSTGRDLFIAMSGIDGDWWCLDNLLRSAAFLSNESISSDVVVDLKF
jgi:hypothetical protein